jgi:hypothetical protein
MAHRRRGHRDGPCRAVAVLSPRRRHCGDHTDARRVVRVDPSFSPSASASSRTDHPGFRVSAEPGLAHRGATSIRPPGLFPVRCGGGARLCRFAADHCARSADPRPPRRAIDNGRDHRGHLGVCPSPADGQDRAGASGHTRLRTIDSERRVERCRLGHRFRRRRRVPRGGGQTPTNRKLGARRRRGLRRRLDRHPRCQLPRLRSCHLIDACASQGRGHARRGRRRARRAGTSVLVITADDGRGADRTVGDVAVGQRARRGVWEALRVPPAAPHSEFSRGGGRERSRSCRSAREA